MQEGLTIHWSLWLRVGLSCRPEVNKSCDLICWGWARTTLKKKNWMSVWAHPQQSHDVWLINSGTSSALSAQRLTSTTTTKQRRPCRPHPNTTTNPQATQHVRATMAATAGAGARDATRLKPLVCFLYLYIFYFIFSKSRNDNGSPSRSRSRARDQTSRVAWAIGIVFFLFFFCFTE